MGFKCKKHPCTVCGKETNNISTCSVRCSGASKKENKVRGKLHPFYIHGQGNHNGPFSLLKKRTTKAVRVALQKGELTKEDNCSLCGSGYYVYPHHEDYNKPLEVVWLCQKCHMRLHRQQALALK